MCKNMLMLLSLLIQFQLLSKYMITMNMEGMFIDQFKNKLDNSERSHCNTPPLNPLIQIDELNEEEKMDFNAFSIMCLTHHGVMATSTMKPSESF